MRDIEESKAWERAPAAPPAGKGRVVLIYYHATSERTPLNLGVSQDRCRASTPGTVVESEVGEYSYPAILQGKDGTIHLAYTWNRRRIRYASLCPDDLPNSF